MYEIPEAMRRKIRKYQPIETEGLTLYPVTVAEYESFADAAPAITLLQRCLDPEFQTMPILEAYYRMDTELIRNGEQATGLFAKALCMLALSLRLGEGKTMQERIELFRIVENPNSPGSLKAVRCRQKESQADITPRMFSRFRVIMADQNGLEIPDEDTNPELLEAERDLRDSSIRLNESLGDMLSTIALFSGMDETEMDDWAILRMMRYQKAINRVLNYMVCGIGQSMGGKFKGGNPYPSPFYDRIRDTDALMNLNSVAGGQAAQKMTTDTSIL